MTHTVPWPCRQCGACRERNNEGNCVQCVAEKSHQRTLRRRAQGTKQAAADQVRCQCGRLMCRRYQRKGSCFLCLRIEKLADERRNA